MQKYGAKIKKPGWVGFFKKKPGFFQPCNLGDVFSPDPWCMQNNQIKVSHKISKDS